MGRLLGAPTAQVQLTISFYLFGFAVAQVFYGPLSDRHGRKPVLLAALGIYLLATLACAFTTSIEALIAARFVQAVGASGAIVLARAVVRDMYDGARIGRELSRMAAIMALAPLVAPLIGGVLQTLFGWRSNFVALFCYGAMAAGMVWLLLPETLRQRAPEPVSPLSIVRSYRRFLGDRIFVIHLGIAICCMSGLFAWISTGAFILQDIYGLSALAFGFTFAVASAGYLLGTLISARFVTRWGSGRTMGAGAVGMAAGGLGALLVMTFGVHEAIGLVTVRRALHVRHGDGVAAGAGRRAHSFSGSRRRRVVVAWVYHADQFGGHWRDAWPQFRRLGMALCDCVCAGRLWCVVVVGADAQGADAIRASLISAVQTAGRAARNPSCRISASHLLARVGCGAVGAGAPQPSEGSSPAVFGPICKSGQAGDGDTLMRRLHDPGPHVDRHAAARRFPRG